MLVGFVPLMRGMLLRRPQVHLSVSMTGLDGLAAVRLQRPSLILLDMHLPDISGLELLRHLKDDDTLVNIHAVRGSNFGDSLLGSAAALVGLAVWRFRWREGD